MASVGCREGVGKFSLIPGVQMGQVRATWIAAAIHPNTDTIWMEMGMNHSSHGLNLE